MRGLVRTKNHRQELIVLDVTYASLPQVEQYLSISIETLKLDASAERELRFSRRPPPPPPPPHTRRHPLSPWYSLPLPPRLLPALLRRLAAPSSLKLPTIFRSCEE